MTHICQHIFYLTFFLIYFPRPFIRQTHKLLIWKFILFCTTCFSHQALVTCCLQLMGFEPPPQQVKVVLASNPKSYKKVKVRPQSNNRTPQKLGFKNQAPQGLADPLPSSTSSQTPSSLDPPRLPRLPRPSLLHRPQPLRAELENNSSLAWHPDSYCQGWPGYPLQCIGAMGAAELPHGFVPLVALPRAWTPPPW